MKTLVLGASPNPSRYAYLAAIRLKKYGHEVVPVGIKKGEIEGMPILNGKPELEDIHTVTLYINPLIQKEWYDYILSLHPARIIFNPGTENRDFENIAQEKGIKTIEACTLVMLATGVYDEEQKTKAG